jgi:hypothetical protein
MSFPVRAGSLSVVSQDTWFLHTPGEARLVTITGKLGPYTA